MLECVLEYCGKILFLVLQKESEELDWDYIFGHSVGIIRIEEDNECLHGIDLGINVKIYFIKV